MLAESHFLVAVVIADIFSRHLGRDTVAVPPHVISSVAERFRR